MLKHTTDKVQLYLQDVLEGLKATPDNEYDLAICDPPYGASATTKWNYDAENKKNGFGGDWKMAGHQWDLLTGNEIFQFSWQWLSELQRVVKPTGSIWIHATYHNSGFVNVACQLLGIEIINEVVWYKRNAFPNLAKRRLTASHETILWVHTGKKKREYHFNYDAIKAASFKEDKLKMRGKQQRTVWDIPNNKAKKELMFGKHDTQKPLRVSERILMVAGTKGGKLLVPFAGSGTEMIAGINYGMTSVGYEIDKTFFELAQKRLEHAESTIQNMLFV